MSGRAFPAATLARASRLHEQGWHAYAIRNMLAREGVDPLPTVRTIQRWTDPDARRRELDAQTRRRRLRVATTEATFRLSSCTPEYVTAFAQRLHAEGVSRTTIPAVLRVTTGQSFGSATIAQMLEEGLARRRCTVCGEPFDPEFGSVGRVPTRCARHRRRGA